MTSRLNIRLYVLIAVIFTYGIAVGHYQLPPYGVLAAAKHWIAGDDKAAPRPSDELISSHRDLVTCALSDPLATELPLLNPTATSYADLAQQVREQMHTIPARQYVGCYDKLITGTPQQQGNLIDIPFALGRDTGRAWAYKMAGAKPSRAIIVIPGTGRNQGTDIIYGRGYHGNIATVLQQYGDVFVQMKPNEDCRAIHDGHAKLTQHFVNVHLLRQGYSYSSAYMFETLSLVKYLTNHYDEVGVVGLSQGGQAALFTALEAEPNFAVVASGFSPLQWDLAMADSSQVQIPQLYEDYTLAKIRERLKQQRTRYLFTFGETEGTLYEFDATESVTKAFLETVGRSGLKYSTHPGGHAFDMTALSEFMDETHG